MTAADIGEGLCLCRMSHWNQLEDDWRAFLEPADGGGCLAEKDGSVVGSVTFLRYGSAFTWLSMMLVDPAQRHAGIGSQLLEAALEAIGGEPCVRLDASAQGEPLYRRRRFVPEYTIVRMRTTVNARFSPSPDRVRPLTAGDLAEACARDRDVFGADRGALLSSFHRRAPELAWISAEAYCFGRPGYLYDELGPIVAGDESAARQLVSHCLAHQDGRAIAVDAPKLVPEWSQWLESVGFEVDRPFLRMRLGGTVPFGIPERQFGIAGPEFG